MECISGRFELVSLTVPPIDKWEIAQSKLGASKWTWLKQIRSWLIKKKMLEQLKKIDTVGLVSRDWNQSFAQVESNQKAIAKCGCWGPLCYNILLHPEINLDNKSKSFKLDSKVATSELNFTKEISG
jgi:hypothetical protein